jgi:hypothetical protein
MQVSRSGLRVSHVPGTPLQPPHATGDSNRLEVPLHHHAIDAIGSIGERQVCLCCGGPAYPWVVCVAKGAQDAQVGDARGGS